MTRMNRIWTALIAAGLLCSPAIARQGDEQEQELSAARARIHAMLDEARELEQHGQREEARAKRNEAEELQSRLHRHLERLEHGVQRQHLEQALHGLELGIEALRRLGRHEAAEQLAHIAEDLRGEARGGRSREQGDDRERRIAVNQLEVMHMALAALREGNRMEAVETLERAIRTREVNLEGRDDSEARQIRERHPSRETLLRVMNLAVELYQEFGAADRADKLRRLTAELWARGERKGERDRHERDGDRQRHQAERERNRSEREVDRDRREVERERGRREREVRRERREVEGGRHEGENRTDREPSPEQMRRDLEIMETAMHAFREADKGDAADLLRYAIQQRIVDHRGTRGQEADMVRERAPSIGQQVEMLRHASRLWMEFGHEHNAEMVLDLSRRLHNDRHGDEGERVDASRERIAALEGALGDLRRMIEELEREVRELSRRR